VGEEARAEWDGSEELQRVMTQDEFVIKMLSTFPTLCGDQPIQDRIAARASLWTESRDALLTTEIQKMDTCPTLEQAEGYWARICAHSWLKFVNPEVLERRAIETRMLCMDESILEGISIRCWKYVFNASTTGEVQCMFDRHLAHYGPVGPAVAERMSVAIVTVLREMLEKPKKIKIWRRLVLATEILGHGLSRLDEKIYEAWWDTVIERRGQGILSTEEDGSFTWNGIPVKEEKLCIWVAERIMTMKVSFAVDVLKTFRIMLDPPLDLAQKVARHLLDKAVCPKDFVRTWVYLFSRSVMSSPWLLQRLFEVTFCEKELKTEFRRRGGKCLHLKLSEEEIPVDTLAQYCGRFLKLGFDFRSDVQALLSRKFEEDSDVWRCAQALKILKEAQVFAAADFKGWYHKVGARFKPEVLEEAMSAPVQATVMQLEHRAQVKFSDKKKLVGLIQAAKAGDPDWRSRADEWILEVKERYRQAFESLEKEWIEWRQSRLRKSPRKHGTIEILCRRFCGRRFNLG
jgi:hypothetical protein